MAGRSKRIKVKEADTWNQDIIQLLQARSWKGEGYCTKYMYASSVSMIASTLLNTLGDIKKRRETNSQKELQ